MIGSSVCDALLARGDEVVGLSRDPGPRPRHEPDRELARMAPRHGSAPPAAAFEGVDAVLNLIGENINQRLTPAAKERSISSRVRADQEPRRRHARGEAARPRPGEPVRGRLLRRPRRGDRRRVDATGRTTGPAAVRRLGGGRAGCCERRRPRRRAPSAPVLDPAGGMLKQLPAVQSRPRRTARRRRQYMPWIHRDDEVALFLWALDTEGANGAEREHAQPTTNREFTKALGRAAAPGDRPDPAPALVAMRGRGTGRDPGQHPAGRPPAASWTGASPSGSRSRGRPARPAAELTSTSVRTRPCRRSGSGRGASRARSRRSTRPPPRPGRPGSTRGRSRRGPMPSPRSRDRPDRRARASRPARRWGRAAQRSAPRALDLGRHVVVVGLVADEVTRLAARGHLQDPRGVRDRDRRPARTRVELADVGDRGRVLGRRAGVDADRDRVEARRRAGGRSRAPAVAEAADSRRARPSRYSATTSKPCLAGVASPRRRRPPPVRRPGSGGALT